MHSPSLPKVILNFYILLSLIQLRFKNAYVEGPSEAVSRRESGLDNKELQGGIE